MEQFCGRGGPLLEMSSEPLSPGQLSRRTPGVKVLKYRAPEIIPMASLAFPPQNSSSIGETLKQ